MTSSRYLLAPLSLWPPANAGPKSPLVGAFFTALSRSALLALAPFFTSFFTRAGHLRCSIYRKVAPCYCDSTGAKQRLCRWRCELPAPHVDADSPPFVPGPTDTALQRWFPRGIGATMSCWTLRRWRAVWSGLENLVLIRPEPRAIWDRGMDLRRQWQRDWPQPNSCPRAAPKGSGSPTKACRTPGRSNTRLDTGTDHALLAGDAPGSNTWASFPEQGAQLGLGRRTHGAGQAHAQPVCIHRGALHLAGAGGGRRGHPRGRHQTGGHLDANEPRN